MGRANRQGCTVAHIGAASVLSGVADFGSFVWTRFEPIDSKPFLIIEDELTGVRALLDFGDRFVRPGGEKNSRWKMKPTVPAELFDVNPPADGPGVFADQLTVVFRQGVSRSRIEEINRELFGSTVLAIPGSRWYRIKLSAKTNLEIAAPAYKSRPEVLHVLPGTNFADFEYAPDDDPNPEQYDISNIRIAWETLRSRGLPIGSHAVRVAVLESNGVTIAHRDIYRNIAINQGELPKGLFDANSDGIVDAAEIAVFDFDGDGVISFRDLEHPGADSIRPVDWNENGYPDGEDLVHDPRWADGVNDDENGIADGSPNGFVDDLVGWNFASNNNRPIPRDNAERTWHGTRVAGLIGAEGDNGYGIAGLNWRVSIVPIRAAAVKEGSDVNTIARAMPDVAFAAAVKYAEELGVDIANVSQGWHFARKGMATDCSAKSVQTTSDLRDPEFADGIAESDAAWAALFEGTRVLWVFAAGNSGWHIGDSRLFLSPAESVQNAVGDRVLLVGAAMSRTARWYRVTDGENSAGSNYGGNVDVYAPGTNLQSLGPSGLFGRSGPGFGTSYSAPVVSGAAALLAATRPGLRGADGRLDPAQLKTEILNTAPGQIDGVCPGRASLNRRILDVQALISAP